ncbi:MAG: response regulator, partial [Pseudomonadota bacterium]
ELLARTDLDAKQRTFTDIIVKSGAALLTIINDILDFSKIDAGQMELDPAPFRLAEAIEDVATLVSSKVAEKDLELAVRIDPALPAMLVGDVGRLRQIVTNLMGNAVKFTDAGHVLVDVSGSVVPDSPAPEPQDGKQPLIKLHLRIEDTGIGIPPEKCRTVFDKFSQVDGSATRRHEGTGLGLAIASSLVELMGGEMGVESQVGKGSTFWFTIVLPAYGQTAEEGVPAIPVDVTGSRILVVDDNAVNRAILLEQLSAWGFDAAVCESGQEGMKVLMAAVEKGLEIDCVLLDYHMPGMNGADVARAMRSNGTFADIPIIMLTSVDHMEDGRAFSSLGIQGQLTKPARSSLLLETIISILAEEQAKRERDGLSKGVVIAQKMGSQDDLSETEMLTTGSGQAQPKALNEQGSATFVENPLTGAQAASQMDYGMTDILVCEDNEVNQMVFRQILEATSYSFEIANNGEEGLAIYKELRPRLILMDVSMPIKNGLEATSEIRILERDTDTHTPIIGVTAHAINGDLEKCIEACMDDYLSKPVSPDRLVEKIENWISAKSTICATA